MIRQESIDRSDDPPPLVRAGGEIAAHSGQRVRAAGIYRAIPAPTKGLVASVKPKTHAFLEMNDGERVYVEALGTAQAARPQDELRRFDGHRVAITGILHRIMPSPRAGLVAPCVSEVESIAATDAR